MGEVMEGRIVRLGHDVNTDLILPGAYLNMVEPDQLGEHLLETYDAELGRAIAPGDILLAGRDFGGGSSREQAPVAIRARGVQAVIATSFARIFLRNAINLALPVFTSPDAFAGLAHHEHVRIDLTSGTIHGAHGQTFPTAPQPPFVRDLIAAGGLVPWARSRLNDPSG
jgi:3-isopropylmalate/(R)-2-methylmalate dehydratase small subunit